MRLTGNTTKVRTCTICKLEKPLDAFTPRKQGKLHRVSACKACRAIGANYTRDRARMREHTYNIRHKNNWLVPGVPFTRTDYIRMKEEQGHRCLVCKKLCDEGLYRDTLVADHHHTTGKVRGLLCMPCNLVAGQVEAQPDKFKAILSYLEAGEVRN